jgi:hypothetical protein
LALGVGEHVCPGAHIARLESFELAGPVQRLRSAVNGGIKHLPLRYGLR